MKKLGLIAIVFVLVVACSQKPKTPPHHGAWKLVQAQGIKGDSVRTTFPTIWQGDQIKMWSEDYYIYVGKWKSNNREGDIFGGGTYTLDDKDYTEYIQYEFEKQYVGKVNKGMTLYLENDTLYQTYHPIDTLGNVRNDVTLLEKYVRY